MRRAGAPALLALLQTRERLLQMVKKQHLSPTRFHRWSTTSALMYAAAQEKKCAPAHA